MRVTLPRPHVCASHWKALGTLVLSVQRQVAVWFRSQRMSVASWYSAPSTKACTSRIQEFNHSLASTVRQLVICAKVIFSIQANSPGVLAISQPGVSVVPASGLPGLPTKQPRGFFNAAGSCINYLLVTAPPKNVTPLGTSAGRLSGAR